MSRRRRAWPPRLPVPMPALLRVAALAVSALACFGGPSPVELARLETTLGLRSGVAVADVGAGDGDYTLWAARIVRPGGEVYSTEIDAERLKRLEARVREAGLDDVTFVEAGITDTGLPEKCCDAIFLRDVYHHLTDPAAIDASLLRALRPGGLLAVIDFPPSLWLSPWTPKGIPKNRGGHGVSPEIVVQELTAGGFELVSVSHDWPSGWLIAHYCALFRRPSSSTPTSSP
ncbi:MAG TPA: class I SAM-dependent methyltransferase [Myxococcota bacterium]|nr:class I SAM-dependent methyltransferase [Myxococcota bacterium]